MYHILTKYSIKSIFYSVYLPMLIEYSVLRIFLILIWVLLPFYHCSITVRNHNKRYYLSTLLFANIIILPTSLFKNVIIYQHYYLPTLLFTNIII